MIVRTRRDTGIIRDRVRAHLSHDPCVVSSSFVLRMCVPSGGHRGVSSNISYLAQRSQPQRREPSGQHRVTAHKWKCALRSRGAPRRRRLPTRTTTSPVPRATAVRSHFPGPAPPAPARRGSPRFAVKIAFSLALAAFRFRVSRTNQACDCARSAPMLLSAAFVHERSALEGMLYRTSRGRGSLR